MADILVDPRVTSSLGSAEIVRLESFCSGQVIAISSPASGATVQTLSLRQTDLESLNDTPLPVGSERAPAQRKAWLAPTLTVLDIADVTEAAVGVASLDVLIGSS
jgi:hypothetical protein